MTKSLSSRLLACAVFAAVIWALLSAATASNAPVLEPDKLIILSTTDVKGELGPCG